MTSLPSPLPGCSRSPAAQAGKQPTSTGFTSAGLRASAPNPQLRADKGTIGVWGQIYFPPPFPDQLLGIIIYFQGLFSAVSSTQSQLPQQEQQLQATSARMFYDKC